MSRDDLFTLDSTQRTYLEAIRYNADAELSAFASRHDSALYEDDRTYDVDTDLVRPAYVRDVDRILNNAFYNRCMDKTQVFPFFRNDDLTRRSFHLQLVSQTARKIGRALRLNTDLIEAISLGHDMGHTPFGHGGERFLSDLYHAHTGRYFNHNVHSVRVLRDVARLSLSLQTLDGVLCHCGEKAFLEYHPGPCSSFEDLDRTMEHCYTHADGSRDLRPNTLEGCVVRICDIIAYLGKDRQDALNIGVLTPAEYPLKGNVLGRNNSDIIRNASINIIKNSIDSDHLAMDEEVFEALLAAREENTELIYKSPEAHEMLDTHIQPMMERVYDRCLADVDAGDEDSYIYRHHIRSWVMVYNRDYENTEPNLLVTDYLASMTDEYFIALHNRLFPSQAVSEQTLYRPYFRD